jgi:hypothetical protein
MSKYSTLSIIPRTFYVLFASILKFSFKCMGFGLGLRPPFLLLFCDYLGINKKKTENFVLTVPGLSGLTFLVNPWRTLRSRFSSGPLHERFHIMAGWSQGRILR